MKKQTGFTLIELLVVIAIIGILSSVVLASLSTARAKSRDARRISDLNQIQLALELYYDASSSYPSYWSSGNAQTFNSASTGLGVPQLITLSLLPKLPADPAGGSSVYYYCPQYALGNSNCSGSTTAQAFSLGANLERADNTALTGDADRIIGTVFTAASSTCVSGTGADQCFDLTN